MSHRGPYSGEDVIKALYKMRYMKDRQRGSHIILKYKHPDTDEIRTVVVPLHDELSTQTLRGIADQCGAEDFQKFLDWLDQLLN